MATKPHSAYRWELLAFCWLAYFLNRADRQIFSAVLPQLCPDLGLSPEQAGLVAMCFTWTYGAMVPLAGYLGDRWRRKWIMVLSLLVWSTATVFTGFAGGLLALIVVRGLATGGGEACYYPAANSLIGQFHERTRALAMSIHQTSVYVGVVAGGWLSGLVARWYGWREAFLLFGAFGLVLAAAAAWRLWDTPQPAADSPSGAPRVPLSEALLLFVRRPTLPLLTLAFAGQVFVESGYLMWMPTFLHEEFHQALDHAGFSSTFYHFLAAFAGVLAGGAITDRLVARFPGIRVNVQVLGMLAAAPFIYLMSAGHEAWICYLGLSGFGLFRGLYDSNLFAAPFDVIPVRFRSSAVGIMLCGAFLVGATSPWILGRMKQPSGLRAGLVVLAVVYAASGLVVLVARLAFFQRDRLTNLLEEQTT
jgi:sugar phosphate permease